MQQLMFKFKVVADKIEVSHISPQSSGLQFAEIHLLQLE